ncbi:uncharacterized protein LOC112637415 [Camponotus floridanus]|uniref:uncharacterized protein LOC112637415 n=1 Tax=Camponotus floridanus TaxID=104421 RepID=UPI000DC6785A|nr:uncharacterized protein LOC112637415 [Camponotus floridanus]
MDDQYMEETDRNDEYALQYCQSHYTDESEVIVKMYRSLDNVDYIQVNIPDTDTEEECAEDLIEIQSKRIENASKPAQQNIDSSDNEKMDISSMILKLVAV